MGATPCGFESRAEHLQQLVIAFSAVAPVNGVARFGDLRIDRSGTGYTLRTTASGATAATSTTFDVLAATGSAPVR